MQHVAVGGTDSYKLFYCLIKIPAIHTFKRSPRADSKQTTPTPVQKRKKKDQAGPQKQVKATKIFCLLLYNISTAHS